MADETAEELSEAKAPEWDEANDPDGYTRADLTPKDWTLDRLLQFTVGSYDDDRGSCGLTVLSGGVVVSGIAISEAEYHRLLIQQLHDAGATDTAHWIGKLNEQQVGLVNAKRREREAANLPYRARRHIHMRNTRVGSGPEAVNVDLWRGALADVTGWSLGSHNDASEFTKPDAQQ